MKIAVFIPTLKGGGAERVMISIANGLSQIGNKVDLIVVDRNGEYRNEIGRNIRIIDLKTGRVIKAIPGLIKYLKICKPILIITTIWHANISAIIATKVSFARTKVVIRESNFLTNSKKTLGRYEFLMTGLVKYCYPLANKIIAPSDGIAKDLSHAFGIKPDKIVVIKNPSIEDWMLEKAREPVKHPWLTKRNQPVFLAMGSLTAQKDFFTLLRAFRYVLQKLPSRLIILGEGKQRCELEDLIKSLRIEYCVDLPGFVDNPFSYMINADVFVLSSQWEGLPNGLIQALGLGMKVVSTDCQSGPREILRNGERGKLVPVGNEEQLAEAMVASMKESTNPDIAEQIIEEYSPRSIIPQYCRIIDQVSCSKLKEKKIRAKR